MKIFIYPILLSLGANAWALPFNHKCESQAKKVLQAWGTLNQWRPAFTSQGQPSYRSPTKTRGVWVEIAKTDHEVRLMHITSKWIKRISIDSIKCTQIEAKEKPFRLVRSDAPNDQLFSDADLEKLLANPQPGVVVVWSPTQAYSVKYYDLFANVAKQLNLNVTYLVSPYAPESAIRAVKGRAGKSFSERRIASVELAMRNLATHAPSVLVYGFGKLSNDVIVGVRDEKSLRNMMVYRLAELAK